MQDDTTILGSSVKEEYDYLYINIKCIFSPPLVPHRTLSLSGKMMAHVFLLHQQNQSTDSKNKERYN